MLLRQDRARLGLIGGDRREVSRQQIQGGPVKTEAHVLGGDFEYARWIGGQEAQQCGIVVRPGLPLQEWAGLFRCLARAPQSALQRDGLFGGAEIALGGMQELKRTIALAIAGEKLAEFQTGRGTPGGHARGGFVGEAAFGLVARAIVGQAEIIGDLGIPSGARSGGLQIADGFGVALQACAHASGRHAERKIARRVLQSLLIRA